MLIRNVLKTLNLLLNSTTRKKTHAHSQPLESFHVRRVYVFVFEWFVGFLLFIFWTNSGTKITIVSLVFFLLMMKHYLQKLSHYKTKLQDLDF